MSEYSHMCNIHTYTHIIFMWFNVIFVCQSRYQTSHGAPLGNMSLSQALCPEAVFFSKAMIHTQCKCAKNNLF